jgi:hypothetical protein
VPLLPSTKPLPKPSDLLFPVLFWWIWALTDALNAEDSTWNQGLWGSRTVNVYYQYPIRFGRTKFSFNPGIGLSMERWKFTNGAMLIDTVELVSFPNGAAAANQS